MSKSTQDSSVSPAAPLLENGGFENAFEHAPIGVALIGVDGRWLQVNPAVCRLLGYSAEELLRMTFMDVTHPDDLESSLARRRGQLDGMGDAVQIEKRYVRRDGETVWVSLSSTLVRDDSGRAQYSVTVIEDISERIRAREAAREAEERFRYAFDEAPIGMALVTPDGRFARVNRKLEQITGYEADELLELTFQEITHPEDVESDVEQMGQVLRGEMSTYAMQKRYLRPDGNTVWVLLSVSLVRDQNGDPLYFVSQVEDITDRKRQEVELERLANFDALTGLGNRRKLLNDLESMLEEPWTEPFGLAFFDLNGFKAYNDLFGHPAGDTMLARLAQALVAALGDDGVGYRIGGDEFCVVARVDPDAVFARANRALSARGDWFSIEAAYGQVRLPSEATDVSSALQIADGRLYTRKGTSRRTAPQQARDALMQVLIEQDPLLSEHASRVARLAESTARRLGLDEEEVWHVRLAAELHDVGKAAVPEMVLDKPGALDHAEWSFIKRHTLIGERIVSAAPALARVARLIRSSHERPDGGGYPDGLSGDTIPLGARIVAVADAFDAITSDRPYAEARPADYAVEELRRCAGSQFDPEIVEAFVAAILETGDDGAGEQGPSEPSGRLDVAPSSVRPLASVGPDKRLRRALSRARACHWENPRRARDVAEAVAARALAQGHSGLYGRALVLEAQVETRQGRLDRAIELLEAARGETKRSGEVELRAELAIAESRISFLAGLYDDALAQAQEAIALGDAHGLDEIRLAARRGLTLVLGNVDDQCDELRCAAREWLDLSIQLGDRKEEMMARNDVAYTMLLDGCLDEAREEIDRTIELATALGATARFPLAYAYSTRAEILIRLNEPQAAVADCRRSLALADAGDDPEPYLTAMTIQTKLRALLATGDLDRALLVGRSQLDRLNQDLPHARSEILRMLADALHQAGRADEAFEAFRESADLDRATFEQLTGRQLGLQRAALEAEAARHEAQILSAKNEQLEALLSTLDERRRSAADAA